MEILLQLGANETVFIQFLLFVVTISFLTVFIFNPYFKAYDQRHKLTKGAEQVAGETQDEQKKLEQIYQLKAREINSKIKTIFDSSNQEASKVSQEKIELAKNQIAIKINESAKQIDLEKNNAEKQVLQIADGVSQEITKKIMGTV